MAGFNVERFVAITFGLATAGAIGAAVWTATQDEEGGDRDEQSHEEADLPEPEPQLAEPDVGQVTPPPAKESPDLTQVEAPVDPPPHPAVETPSWQ